MNKLRKIKNENSAHRLSIAEARRCILAAQGFWGPQTFSRGKKGTREVIQHLGYVQIDTISIVERAHHHTLWSRLPDYRPEFLDQLLSEGKIFEYWSHAASYLPIEDFRFSLRRKKLYSAGKSYWHELTHELRKARKHVLERIQSDGALSARDFEAPENFQGAGWFDWKPAKRALEQLFMDGKLMVAGRRGFQKIYDLSERVLPANVDTRFPSDAEYAEYLIRSGLRGQGLLRLREVAHLRKKPMRDLVQKQLRHLLREGEVVEVTVEGHDEKFYSLAETWEDLREQASSRIGQAQVRLLSPFDNLVIRRERLRDLFDFDFTIECYVPAAKRKFGYFCLPLLQGDAFLGRVDPKADRENGKLLLKGLHWEKTVRGKTAILNKAGPHFQEFARFNGCQSWLFSSSTGTPEAVLSRDS